jgi:hypothetical protein
VISISDGHLEEHITSTVKETMELKSGMLLGPSMSSEPNFQHSDPRMKLSICEAKITNSFGDLFSNF